MLMLEIMNVFEYIYIYIYIYSAKSWICSNGMQCFLFIYLSQTSLVTLFKNVPFVDRPT